MIEVSKPVKTPVDRFVELADKLPLEAIVDIKTRMGDYVLSGGKINDPYMWQQARYAENLVEAGITR